MNTMSSGHLTKIKEELVMNKKKIFIFLGPSGAGKTEIAKKLKKDNIPELVSTTDRNPRPGEENGINYHFVSKEGFKEVDLVEFAEYAGNYYGLSTKEVDEKLSKYDTVYSVMEVNGVRAIKEKYGDIVTVIFVTVSPEIARQRMVVRGDTEEAINDRINNAIIQKEYDNIIYADEVIDNNGTPEEAESQLSRIVEKLRN